MSIAIPIFDRSGFRYTIPLGDTTFALRFRWNSVDESWYLSIWTSSLDAALVSGLRLVYGVDLLQQVQHLVPGRLTIREKNDSDGSRPLRADFGELSGLIVEYETL